ncbi:MAG: chorismate mutase [Selenomonadaceae bacterium]|nr:chorismate mutase [Selenomonadaceae bacterium]MBQ3726953.1 chorismate mutase [Selenomonadaceae bacterium]MBQ9497699.1 chorismate mutase [Selenomonadaceae bacterium]
MRGIRGATTVDENSKEKIWQAARQLVTEILSQNKLRAENIGAIIFSTTEDLTAAFPSTALRERPAFRLVPLFDTREPAVENSLPLCIRVLILTDTNEAQNKIHHVYLGGAKNLRPDLDRD